MDGAAKPGIAGMLGEPTNTAVSGAGKASPVEIGGFVDSAKAGAGIFGLAGGNPITEFILSPLADSGVESVLPGKLGILGGAVASPPAGGTNIDDDPELEPNGPLLGDSRFNSASISSNPGGNSVGGVFNAT